MIRVEQVGQKEGGVEEKGRYWGMRLINLCYVHV